MSLRDLILDYIDDTYGDLFISDELEEKIVELEEFIDSAYRIEDDDEDEEDDDEPLEYREDMDDFNDEE